MKIGRIIPAIFIAIISAGPASADDHQTETVAIKFNHVLPNTSGKSLIVVEVDYPPGALPSRTDMPDRPLSMPTCSRARSSQR
ncbi:exported hypothetical protein [Mesorhizobium plurifarium]|uniref:Uncharacterized protein n=1 Tax=Mesorhizobium plurifarium TaxID=69974 RepID=A0A090FH05_MESPL|nr:exported hypothetical protein [Mesorhizobium plurifarium]